MAKEEPAEDRCRPGEVQVTIVVMPSRALATLTKFLAGARVRTALVAAGVVAAVAAGTTIAVWSSSGRAGGPLDALAEQFGHRADCTRLTVVSPEGAYARIDLDHSGPCGSFGYQLTLILHRVHGVWVREFQGATWTCPIRRLPRPVAIQLRLCHSESAASGGAISRGA